MRNRPMHMSAFALALVFAASATAQYTTTSQTTSQQPTYQRATSEMVEQTLATWMSQPRDVARTLIAKYGMPNTASGNVLVWHNNGPWKMTILENVMIPHNFPVPHYDMLYQYIDQSVPESLFDDLARYDGSVIVERTRGTLGARCDNEQANFLAVNLAHDIITGKRSVNAARDFYGDAVKAKMDGDLNSDQSRYMDGFTFDVYASDYGDRDYTWDGSSDVYADYEADDTRTYSMNTYKKEKSYVPPRMNGLPGRPNYGNWSDW